MSKKSLLSRLTCFGMTLKLWSELCLPSCPFEGGKTRTPSSEERGYDMETPRSAKRQREATNTAVPSGSEAKQNSQMSESSDTSIQDANSVKPPYKRKV